MTERPILFLVTSSAVWCALVTHGVRLYGWRLAARLMVPMLLLASVKEVFRSPELYVVQFEGMRPLGFPAGVVAGWMTASLLSIEFSRRLSRAIAPAAGQRLFFRLFFAGLFTWFLSHAIEPVAQGSNWWVLEPNVPFPRFIESAWIFTVVMMCLLGLATAHSTTPREFARVALSIVAFLGCLVIVAFLLGPIAARAPEALLALFVLSPLLALVVPWFRLRPELLDPPGEGRLPFWFAHVPLAATWAILLTLVWYALRGRYPRFVLFCIPLAVVSFAPYAAPGLVAALRGGRDAKRRADPSLGGSKGNRESE